MPYNNKNRSKQISISILDVPPHTLLHHYDILHTISITHIHVDIIDTSFVSSTTSNTHNMLHIPKNTNFIYDYHFMVNDPLILIKNNINLFQNSNITIHREIDNYENTLQYLLNFKHICNYNWKVTIAVKPETYSIIENNGIDRILILLVEPGKGNQKMIQECVKKIDFYRNMTGNECEIGVDGGVNLNTIRLVKNADYFVIGSWYVKSNDKALCVKQLYKVLEEDDI